MEPPNVTPPEAGQAVAIARDGQELGSFSPDEVREGLRRGRFQPGDFYFVEGMTEWRPLAEWAVTPAGRPSRRRSILWVGAGVLFLGTGVLIGILGLVVALWPSKPSEPFPETLALFRTGVLHDWEATLHRYGSEPVQRQFGEWSLEMWSPIAPDVGWSYWFNTAVFTGVRLESARPRTAFYHPWSDTFWLAEWDLSGKPRITKAWFGAGDVLRSNGQPPWDPAPLWLRGRGPRADALASALAQSIPAAERALERRSWPDGATRKDPGRSANAALCRATLLDLLLGIESLRRSVGDEDAGMRRLRDGVRGLLRHKPAALAATLRDAPENTPEMRRAAGALPAEAAATLTPVCRLGSGGTAMVILMPSQTSDVALATVWDVGRREARLLRADVLPFAELLRAARVKR